MTRISGKTLFIALMMLLPFSLCVADEFDEEFGGGGGEKKAEEELFDAEKSASDKEDADKQASDQAIKDLLGDTPAKEEPEEEEEEVAPAKKADDFEEEEEAPKKAEPKKSVDDLLGTKKKEEKKKAAPSAPAGIKPVIMVKGSFNFGGYTEKPAGAVKSSAQSLMFGAVEEGILGAEYTGKSIFAKGTINVRTNNPLLSSSGPVVQYNPLMDDNYTLNSILNGMPYEVYGGMKLFDVLILRAGKMIPSYGILDKYQHLGVAIGTPYGTRSLLATEGWIPETDAGFGIGFDYALDDESGVTAELQLATGVIPSISQYWFSQKTMGIYFKGGYRSEMITAMLGFQYRTDYEATTKKQIPFIGFGLGAIFSYEGFETWLTFDYTMANLIRTITPSGQPPKYLISDLTGGMSLSIMPAYNLSIDYGIIDKLQFGVRFDLNYGVYNRDAAAGNYLHWYSATSTASNALKNYTFKNDAMTMRFGIAINLFAKEFETVRSFWGISFMMQPQSQLVNMNGSTNDVFAYGFYNVSIQGGAEF